MVTNTQRFVSAVTNTPRFVAMGLNWPLPFDRAGLDDTTHQALAENKELGDEMIVMMDGTEAMLAQRDKLYVTSARSDWVTSRFTMLGSRHAILDWVTSRLVAPILLHVSGASYTYYSPRRPVASGCGRARACEMRERVAHHPKGAAKHILY
jgi:hypothetical protein